MNYLYKYTKFCVIYGFIWIFISLNSLFGQNFTNYITGNINDTLTLPQGGVCMMGGATEHDEAMRWFLRRANGGDVLVLRATGTNGYNKYMYSQLGVKVNSVETIVCNNKNASTDNYVIQKIRQAEAIWFAGGDQWDYVSYWRDTPVAREINKAIQSRNIVIGGTSAGMAILGGYYFNAKNGSVTSQEALSNPYRRTVTVDSTHFLSIPYLSDVITDTHYDDPDRKGRHVVFLSRILKDYQQTGLGIACNAYVAVCVDETGKASVYGDHPKYQEFAYFIMPNCSVENNQPEILESGKPLTWNQGGEALKVYKVPGTNIGSNTFDLNTWRNGNGGEWLHWSVENGTLSEVNGTAPDCDMVNTTNQFQIVQELMYPNPTMGILNIMHEHRWDKAEVYNQLGELVYTGDILNSSIDLSALESGFYIVFLINDSENTAVKILKL